MKKFDEIFAQRGEQVQPENMVKGEYYFLDRSKRSYIFNFTDVAGENIFAEYILCKSGLLIDPVQFDGRTWVVRVKGGTLSLFKATPDQVELLNSYRV